jgi:hypothetical protein
MENKNKTFLLCLGAQKAGTSWLWDFIKDIQTVDLGYRKEYHIFDRLQFDELLQEDIRALKIAANSEKIFGHSDLWKRLSMISNEQEYYNYFINILASDDTSLTGDFTPEYSLLDSNSLCKIKQRFANYGIRTKVIYLMRDPVERIWSANRMTMRILGNEIPLIGSHKAKFVELLTRYENIIPKIKSVFSQEDIYFNFYENLFQEKTIQEILNFLDLPYKQANFSKRVNESEYSEIDQNDRGIVEQHYAETYAFVKEHFKENNPWKGGCRG